MGYLLKEALKTLCGVNQWSYAAFWKIGCQNTKLLIWEECYYEPVLCLVSSQDSGIGTSLREWEGCLIAPHHDVQARERIELLVNQMMVKNQISIVGEGIIGRAAFTGNHEWILSESYNGDSHPPEVLNEMQHQFSSGMKTVVVIPVSPHGVVQLGSSLSIMENAGFVNEVRNMIIQLGFIPGVLFSDGYESKSSLEIPNHDNFKQINSSSSCSSAFQASNGILTPGGSLGRSCYPELSELVTSDVDMLLSQHAASLSHRGDFAEKRDNLEGVPLFRKTDQISNSRNTDKERLKNKNMLVGEILPSWIDEVEEHDNGRSQSIITNVKYEEPSFEQYSSFGDDLFDIFGEDLKNKILGGNFANLAESSSKKNPDGDFPSLGQSFLGNNDLDGDHLLDAVVTKAQSASKQCSEDNVSCKTSLTKISSSSAPSGSPAYQKVNSSDRIGMETIIHPEKITAPVSCSPSNSFYSSQISSWVEQSHSMKVESSVSTAYSKKQDGTMKPNRKRTKPGENPRPRPKDRQMIQDRVKELREIVPNASKCSIDALLERTIKHMLFLQSVTKHADKLKESGQSKIMNKDGGVAMKDNLEGGATWAFEVGSQSMVCPIIVEDLNPPRQMLVEMLCEDRGFFLEIADIVRGLGLTILKGVMEARNGKIWARFAVEANRDVTRMEIFMSLVSLLEQTVGGPSAAKAVHSLAQPGTVWPN